MRFEYLISKTRGEQKGIAGSPEKGEHGPSAPTIGLWLLARHPRAGAGEQEGCSQQRGLAPKWVLQRRPQSL